MNTPETPSCHECSLIGVANCPEHGTETPSAPSLSTLSPEKIRVMCAEAAGYSFDEMTPPFLYGYINGEAKQFPTYHSSLDAVAELRKGLTHHEQEQYINHMISIIVAPAMAEYGPAGFDETLVRWCLISGSALDHCKSYLLTKGLVTL